MASAYIFLFNLSLSLDFQFLECNLVEWECRDKGGWSAHPTPLQLQHYNDSFLAVTWQLNRWPCHSLTHWLSHSVTFTFAIQRAILETCDHWDIWSDRFLEDFQIFGRFLDFWKIFRFLKKYRNCFLLGRGGYEKHILKVPIFVFSEHKGR